MQDQSVSSKVTKKNLFANKWEEIYQIVDFILPRAQQETKQVNIGSGDHVWSHCRKRLRTRRKSKFVLHDDNPFRVLKSDGIGTNSSLDLRVDLRVNPF